MATRIKVRLTTYGTELESETDWDSWVAFVDEHMDEGMGEPVTVDGISWRARGNAPKEDTIWTDATVGIEEHERIETRFNDAIRRLWLEWCATGAPSTEEDALVVVGLVGGDANNADVATWLDLDRGNAPEEWCALVAEDKVAALLESSGASELWRKPWDGSPFGDGTGGMYPGRST